MFLAGCPRQHFIIALGGRVFPAVIGHIPPEPMGLPPRPGLALHKRHGARGTTEYGQPVLFFFWDFQFLHFVPAFEFIQSKKSNTEPQSLQPLRPQVLCTS